MKKKSKNKQNLETRIIGKGRTLDEFVKDTKNISIRLYFLNKTIDYNKNQDYLQFWKTDYYDPYKKKYKLNNEDESFNISRYILNNINY